MDACSPAAQVYDHTRAAIDCLAYTGSEPLLPLLFGAMLLGLGVMARGGLMLFAARGMREAARGRLYPHAKRRRRR